MSYKLPGFKDAMLPKPSKTFGLSLKAYFQNIDISKTDEQKLHEGKYP